MATKIYQNGIQIKPEIDIVNDLTSGGADVALSAEQGKSLESLKQVKFIGTGSAGKILVVGADGNIGLMTGTAPTPQALEKVSTLEGVTGNVQTQLDSKVTKTMTITEYAKGSDSSALTATDTVNQALSKLENQIDGKVVANTAITGGTHTKITYDSKGLVTAGADLAVGDLPAIGIDKITDLQDELDAKQTTANLLSAFQTTPDDTHYISEKLAKDSLDGKQDAFVGTPVNGSIVHFDTSDNKWHTFEMPNTLKLQVPQPGTWFTANPASSAFEGYWLQCSSDDGTYKADQWYLCAATDSTKTTWKWAPVGASVDVSGLMPKKPGTGWESKILVTDSTGTIAASSEASSQLAQIATNKTAIDTINGGKIGTATLGSVKKPVYLNAGTITECTEMGEAAYKNVASDMSTASNDKLPTVSLISSYATDNLAPKAGLTDGSVTKVGTDTVGGSAKICYLNAGVPTAGITFSKGTADPTGGSDGDVYFQYE